MQAVGRMEIRKRVQRTSVTVTPATVTFFWSQKGPSCTENLQILWHLATVTLLPNPQQCHCNLSSLLQRSTCACCRTLQSAKGFQGSLRDGRSTSNVLSYPCKNLSSKRARIVIISHTCAFLPEVPDTRKGVTMQRRTSRDSQHIRVLCLTNYRQVMWAKGCPSGFYTRN